MIVIDSFTANSGCHTGKLLPLSLIQYYQS